MLRSAVIWRKKSFGSASQQPGGLACLATTIAAHRRGEPTPAIAPKLKPTEIKLRKVA